MKINIIAIVIIVIITSFFIIKNCNKFCDISDQESITLVKEFCNKNNITITNEPMVQKNETPWLICVLEKTLLMPKIKEVEIGNLGDHNLHFKISCKNKEIIQFVDLKIDRDIRKKYKIPSLTDAPHNWPPFLPENKAKEIIFSLAHKIGLPPDIELSRISLDKQNGHWGGYWTRKLNGYPYSEDYFSVHIMAVDGEFEAFSKDFKGEPCSTDVKISKEEAINQALHYSSRFMDSKQWTELKDIIEVKSAELQIVQPNAFLGFPVFWSSSNSRLAWVVDFQVIESKKKYGLSGQILTVKIDAATKKLRGGAFKI